MWSALRFMSSENEIRPQKGTKCAVINCAQVVTLAGPARPRVGAELRELGILSNGGLVVRDGLVERVGTRAEIEKLFESDTTVVDAGGRVVLPGFVDAHTHPVF